MVKQIATPALGPPAPAILGRLCKLWQIWSQASPQGWGLGGLPMCHASSAPSFPSQIDLAVEADILHV